MHKVNKDAEREAYLDAVVRQLKEVRIAKNGDYGAAYERHGVKGLLVRLWDKYARLENLVLVPQQQRVKESLRDTALDLVNYGLLLLWVLAEEEYEES